MADQPIDPGLLDAWIRDMRAQLKRIDKALQPPEERPEAPTPHPFRKRRRKAASEALRLPRYRMTQ